MNTTDWSPDYEYDILKCNHSQEEVCEIFKEQLNKIIAEGQKTKKQ